MAHEIAITKEESAVVVKSESQQILDIIGRIACDPNADVAKMDKILDLQERIMAKRAEAAFNASMSEMQDELPMIEKTSKAHNSKYAKLEDIHSKIAPVLKKYGFSLSFDSDWQEKHVLVTGTVSHQEKGSDHGHSKSSTIRLPIDNSGSKNDVQGMGSTLSYARRYLLGMLLNLVTKDEDLDGIGDTITLEQAAIVDARLNKIGGDKKAFLTYFKVEDVRNIPSKDYAKVDAALSKREKVKK